jgi:hypothetical protein
MLHRSHRLLVVLTLVLLSLAGANAQTTRGGFVATRPIELGGTPWGVATGDLNHDGIPDIVIAAGTSVDVNYQHTILGVDVLLGKGDGTFAAAVHYMTTGSASFVGIADVNGDGLPDVITANGDPSLLDDDGAINVLLGKGDGTLQAAVKYAITGQIATSFYVGDFNGDGHPDLAVATVTPFVGSGYSILLNNGSGVFHVGQQGTDYYPVEVGDIDKDGRLDLVMAQFVGSATGPASALIKILFGAGNGAFTRSGPVHTITNFSNGPFVVVADFNEDGLPDVVVNGATQLLVFLGHGDGSFTQPSAVAKVDQRTGWMVTGDFNHDGHVDVAIMSDAGQEILTGNGNGAFGYRTIYGNEGDTAQYPEGMAMADFNNDGYQDLVTVNPGGSYSVMMGKPGATFNAELIDNLGPFENVAPVTGDFNGDGIPDVAVLNSAYGTVSLMMGQSNGQSPKPQTVRYKTGTRGSAFAVGDINGDGKQDLLVESDYVVDGDAAFGLLLGNGNGTFQAPRTMSNMCSGGGGYLVLADMNGDGRLDVVTGCGVSLGNGDGTFQDPIAFCSSSNCSIGQKFAIGDFNGDGKLDYAFVSDLSPISVFVHLGDGAGHMNPTPSYTVNLPYGDTYRNYIAAGHFTTNGKLGLIVGSDVQDLFTHTLPYGAFDILGGKGDGTFMTPVEYQLSQVLIGFGVADINGDGIDDVVAVNAGNDGSPTQGVQFLASLFTSKGDGTLLPEVRFGSGAIAVVAAADFNNDGAVDLVGNIGGLGAGVLMNSNGTKVVLGNSSSTSHQGQAVTLTTTVSASFRFGGNLSGSVTFYDGNTVLGTKTLAGGVATLTTSSLALGSHTIRSVYSGNTNYNKHASNTVSEVVSP